jgi:hypothetical protein
MVEWRKNQKTISVLVLRELKFPEDKDRDGPRNVGFFAIQPFDTAGSPR